MGINSGNGLFGTNNTSDFNAQSKKNTPTPIPLKNKMKLRLFNDNCKMQPDCMVRFLEHACYKKKDIQSVFNFSEEEFSDKDWEKVEKRVMS